MNKPTVYVDLDGTLTPSDLLLESCLLLVRKNFLYVFALVFWSFHGPWRLKCEVSTRVSPHVDVLPIHVAVLDRLNQLKAAGHRLVLASASMHDNVIQLASRLGLFRPCDCKPDAQPQGRKQIGSHFER